MNPFENTTDTLLGDDYIGDELTREDLEWGYAAFLEDHIQEITEPAGEETR